MGIISDNYSNEIAKRKLPLQAISNLAHLDNAQDSTRPRSQTGSKLLMGFRQAVNGQLSRRNRNAMNADQFFSANVEEKGGVTEDLSTKPPKVKQSKSASRKKQTSGRNYMKMTIEKQQSSKTAKGKLVRQLADAENRL